jgi:hypothetical protein
MTHRSPSKRWGSRIPRWAVHKRCVGTARRKWRDPALRIPLGRGAGLILIAG